MVGNVSTAANFYACLYSKGDAVSMADSRAEFATIPEARQRSLERAVLWVKGKATSASSDAELEKLIPQAYVMSWQSSGKPLDDVMDEVEDIDSREWIYAMRNILKA